MNPTGGIGLQAPRALLLDAYMQDETGREALQKRWQRASARASRSRNKSTLEMPQKFTRVINISQVSSIFTLSLTFLLCSLVERRTAFKRLSKADLGGRADQEGGAIGVPLGASLRW